MTVSKKIGAAVCSTLFFTIALLACPIVGITAQAVITNNREETVGFSMNISSWIFEQNQATGYIHADVTESFKDYFIFSNNVTDQTCKAGAITSCFAIVSQSDKFSSELQGIYVIVRDGNVFPDLGDAEYVETVLWVSSDDEIEYDCGLIDGEIDFEDGLIYKRYYISKQGESTLESMRYRIDYTLRVSSVPQDPVKEGYTFLGWYYDEGFTQPFDGNLDSKLYAKFEPKHSDEEELPTIDDGIEKIPEADETDNTLGKSRSDAWIIIVSVTGSCVVLAIVAVWLYTKKRGNLNRRNYENKQKANSRKKR